MAPAIPSAELRLSYPLYAVDFDPQDANRLAVGGGGGPARSGVGNKITLLDTSREDSLQIVSEIELSRDEDSVNTLAVGSRRRNSILLYAGINSAEADIKKGKNEHFRVLAAELPSKAKAGAAGPNITELSRSALLSSTDLEAYQRVLRISPPFTGSKQVGAVATGTIGRAKDAQIAIFDVPPAGSNNPAPSLRGKVELVKEAMDVDVLQTSDEDYQLIYCDDYDIYAMNISKTDTTGPHCIFTMPHDESSGAKARPSFRCIRYLTTTFVLAVANLPNAGGAVLQGFRLPRPSDMGKEEEAAAGKRGKARLAISAHLPRSITRATGLAVRNLSPPPSPSARQGDTQFVVAVTGQDSSITVYTVEHQTSSVSDVNLITKLHPVTTLKAVHQGPISGIAFSHFIPPPKPSSSSSAPPTRAPHLKLASVGSMANTLVVHSLPLKKVTPANLPRGPPRPPRYVLGLKSHGPSPRDLIIFSAVVFATLALLLQGLLEVKGLARPLIGARNFTPVSWHAEPAYRSHHDRLISEKGKDGSLFADYRARSAQLATTKGQEDGDGGLVVLHAGGEGDGDDSVSVHVHDEEKHGQARRWDDMGRAQKEAWKERLKKAGHWGEEMGEAVFKGVLFGEIAGVVGAMVR
ncbi:hypothetical protein N656DRAFT_777142 [Canariomyces notabilis]|uniref:Guanine nucleotide-exchange factor SEC12 n=1 Tax=Canariomyces notabilis TaxID=2074819 RepID=A0AAN6TGJ2_9PEZI|nr:hypothetical protein N656DRAFT_777142 [Canariomyces arenarius]